MSELLDQIAARIEKATEGPWSVDKHGHGTGVMVGDMDDGIQLFVETYGLTYTPNPADAEFIAHARTDLPRLLAAVRAVEALADELCEDIPEDAANASMKHAGKVIRRALTEALEGEG